MGCWLIAFALMARETAAAASSSRFAATAGSMSCLSAWSKARRPISSAALRTAGLIGRPRRSTGLTRTPPRSGMCLFSHWVPLHGDNLSEPSRRSAQHQILRPTIPLKEEEYRLAAKTSIDNHPLDSAGSGEVSGWSKRSPTLIRLLADILRSHMYVWREDGITTARTKAATTIAFFGTRILNQ